MVKLWFLAWCFWGLKKCHFLRIYFWGIPKTGSGSGTGAASELRDEVLRVSEKQLRSDLKLTRPIESSGGGVDGAEGSRRHERSYAGISVTADRACNTSCRGSGETVSRCGDTQTVAVVHKVERLTEYLEFDSFADGKIA